MKLNVYAWHEVKADEEIEVESGRVHVRSDEVAKVYVSAQGYEVLAGVGHEVKAQVDAPISVTVVSTGRIWIYQPTPTKSEPRDGMFTNIDKMPVLSDTMLAVKGAMRELQLEKLQLRRERMNDQRMHKRRQEAARKAASDQTPGETPGQTPGETPGQTPGETPGQTPGETVVDQAKGAKE